MDSTTLLYQYKKDIALCISFNYGSKHNDKELEYAKLNCGELNIEHIEIHLSFINQYFKSDLLKSGNDIPEGHYAAESMKSTVVPFRNGIMLSIAAGIAESRELKVLYFANHFGDNAIYPDCRDSFVKPMAEAIKQGTYLNISLQSPYVNLSKRDIAKIGKNLGIDYNKTWSCYKGNTIHCGKCGTCVERIEALMGFDPTEYKDSKVN